MLGMRIQIFQQCNWVGERYKRPIGFEELKEDRIHCIQIYF